MGRYRSKPVEVEAVQATLANVLAWFSTTDATAEPPMGVELEGWADAARKEWSGNLLCHSRNGPVVAESNDWIIAEPGAPGLCYPCKPDVFAAKYFEVPPRPDQVTDASGQIDAAIDMELGQTFGEDVRRMLFNLLDAKEARVRAEHEGKAVVFQNLRLDTTTIASGTRYAMVEGWVTS